jgi:hypothetical protein
MGLGDQGDRDIIMSSAKQDFSEIESQTLDRDEAIISTISIRFRSAPASTGSRTIFRTQPGTEAEYPGRA